MAYGDTGSVVGLTSTTISCRWSWGAATNDPGNLWPEPGASPNPKDRVEDYLNREVCERQR